MTVATAPTTFITFIYAQRRVAYGCLAFGFYFRFGLDSDPRHLDGDHDRVVAAPQLYGFHSAGQFQL